MSTLISGGKYVLAFGLWAAGLSITLIAAFVVSLIVWGLDTGYASAVVTAYLPMLLAFAGIAHFERSARIHEACIAYVVVWYLMVGVVMLVLILGRVTISVFGDPGFVDGWRAGIITGTIPHLLGTAFWVISVFSSEDYE